MAVARTLISIVSPIAAIVLFFFAPAIFVHLILPNIDTAQLFFGLGVTGFLVFVVVVVFFVGFCMSVFIRSVSAIWHS